MGAFIALVLYFFGGVFFFLLFVELVGWAGAIITASLIIFYYVVMAMADKRSQEEIGYSYENTRYSREINVEYRRCIAKGEINDDLRQKIDRYAGGKPMHALGRYDNDGIWDEETQKFTPKWKKEKEDLIAICTECSHKNCVECEYGCAGCKTPTSCFACSIDLHLYEQKVLKKEAERQAKYEEDNRKKLEQQARLSEANDSIIKAIDARARVKQDIKDAAIAEKNQQKTLKTRYKTYKRTGEQVFGLIVKSSQIKQELEYLSSIVDDEDEKLALENSITDMDDVVNILNDIRDNMEGIK